MDYRKYSAEDFALDEKFQKWVLEPNEEVVAFWEAWIKGNPSQKLTVDSAIELIKLSGLTGNSELNKQYLQVWKNLHDNIVENKQRELHRFNYLKVAAVFIGLAVSTFFLWNYLNADQSIEYRTAFGEVKEFVLEDGSKVTLNSNSSLKLSGHLNDKAVRKVFLDGEGFFEIVKTSDHKTFEVNTEDQVSIQVLGTEFNVSTRRQQVEVYLQSGKVKISSLAGEATLKPGDFVIYQKGKESLLMKENVFETSPELLDWKSNYYVFNDTPLSEIIQELKDNYGFTIEVKDSLLSQRKITAKISRKDVSVLFKVLSETLNINIKQNGNQLVFNAN